MVENSNHEILSNCSPDFFEAMMQHKFQVTSCSDDSIIAELQLVEVKPYPDRVVPEVLRIPFSLLFQPVGEAEIPMSCATYRFEHPEKGTIEMYACPVSIPTVGVGPVPMLEVVFG